MLLEATKHVDVHAHTHVSFQFIQEEPAVNCASFLSSQLLLNVTNFQHGKHLGVSNSNPHADKSHGMTGHVHILCAKMETVRAE